MVGGGVELRGLLICRDEAEALVVRDHLPLHVELTRAEPGCQEFVVEPADEPLVWTVSERFVDAAAFRAHQARVAASEWGAATAGIQRDYVVEGVIEGVVEGLG